MTNTGGYKGLIITRKKSNLKENKIEKICKSILTINIFYRRKVDSQIPIEFSLPLQNETILMLGCYILCPLGIDSQK